MAKVNLALACGCALGLLTASVTAADCGPYGSPDVLQVSDWTLEVSPSDLGMDTAKVMVEVTNVGANPIRMVEGSVMFEDALGGRISSVGIDRDLKVAPGATASWNAEVGGAAFERIPDLVREEVAVFACVQAALFDDGTKWDFEPPPDTSLADELQQIINGQ